MKEASSTLKRALTINLDPKLYGSFAEIGAGQEVVRHFFQAGGAAGTIAKSMSAYDMAFSDSIYGKEPNGRYVTLSRLNKMLNHEFKLLQERLAESRGDSTCFFTFANTVTARNYSGSNRCHGWLGLRFQTHPNGPANDVVLHVNLLDKTNLQQQEAIGSLGVNLVYSAIYHYHDPDRFIPCLLTNLNTDRIEIDMIAFVGEDLNHIDNRIMSLGLLQHNLTNAVLFDTDGSVIQPSDHLYKKNIFIQRGTFRPVTQANLDILEHGISQFVKDNQLEKNPPVILNEITTHTLETDGELNHSDFLERVDTLAAIGHRVLVSKFQLFYEIKSYLRKLTPNSLGLVIGAGHLDKIFDESYYKSLSGGLLESCGLLFDDKTKLYVYPYQKDGTCVTSQSYNPPAKHRKLYDFLKERDCIKDITGCDETRIAIHSADVRRMLIEGNLEWEKHVPENVAKLIKAQNFFKE